MQNALHAFVQLTEIRNAMARHIESLPRYAEPIVQIHIEDQIEAEWDRAQNMITRLKQTRYDKSKATRDAQYRHQVVDINKKTGVGEWYDVALVENAQRNADLKKDMMNVEHDAMHDDANVQKEVTDVIHRYTTYHDKLTAFLKAHDFFNWNESQFQHRHNMKVGDLVTRRDYAIYLRGMFRQMCNLAFRLVNHRIQSDEYNQIIQNRKQIEKIFTGNYFSHSYELKDNREIMFAQKDLEKLVAQLHTLYVHIADTRVILGEIIADTAIREYRHFLNTKFTDNNIKYQLQRLQRKPLLPTSWSSWFRGLFVTKDVNGKYRLLNSSYFRYVAFWFEQNKITNQHFILTVDVLNVSTDDARAANICNDLVDFLFLVERPCRPTPATLLPPTATPVPDVYPMPTPSCPPASAILFNK